MKWILRIVLVSVALAVSACSAETEPATDVTLKLEGCDGNPGFCLEARLHSKVTVSKGQAGHVWFEHCYFRPSRPCSNWTRVGYTSWGPAGRDGGPWDYQTKLSIEPNFNPWTNRGEKEYFRICGDLVGDGWQTGAVCWDRNGDVVRDGSDPDYDSLGDATLEGSSAK